jgi:hypothetical protein
MLCQRQLENFNSPYHWLGTGSTCPRSRSRCAWYRWYRFHHGGYPVNSPILCWVAVSDGISCLNLQPS